MGGIAAPASGSGTWPAWIARVASPRRGSSSGSTRVIGRPGEGRGSVAASAPFRQATVEDRRRARLASGVAIPAAGTASNARCLIVDDDPLVRAALVRVVESQGLTCLQAGSGAEALAVLRTHGEVPLCISDIYMPEMDGVSFL